MAMWNPWRGCHRYSAGCKFCYIHQADRRRGVDMAEIVTTKLDKICFNMIKGDIIKCRIYPRMMVKSKIFH